MNRGILGICDQKLPIDQISLLLTNDDAYVSYGQLFISLTHDWVKWNIESRIHFSLSHFLEFFFINFKSLFLILLFSVVAFIIRFSNLCLKRNYLIREIFNFLSIWLAYIWFLFRIFIFLFDLLDNFYNFLVFQDLNFSRISNNISLKIPIL